MRLNRSRRPIHRQASPSAPTQRALPPRPCRPRATANASEARVFGVNTVGIRPGHGAHCPTCPTALHAHGVGAAVGLHPPLQVPVPVVLYRVVGPAGEELRNHRPAVAQLRVLLDDYPFFLHSEGLLSEVGVQLVDPPRPAALAVARHAAAQLSRDLAPVLRSVLLNQPHKLSVLLRLPIRSPPSVTVANVFLAHCSGVLKANPQTVSWNKMHALRFV